MGNPFFVSSPIKTLAISVQSSILHVSIINLTSLLATLHPPKRGGTLKQLYLKQHVFLRLKLILTNID